ncbi:MAG: adenosylcobinamide amidohydrolase [Methanoregulaceae archaeon]|nr:adenosylcobinamide amidohydrolase [Methanoregulaceae archaeon]
MRYYLREGTLFVRGRFRSVSTGAGGGIGTVSTLLNHTVPPDWHEQDPLRELSTVTSREGLPGDFFGLITAVKMQHLCILQYDFMTVFISAGIHTGSCGTINIILHSGQGMSDAALTGGIITATEAKSDALRGLGHLFSGTPTDAVIVASEGPVVHPYAGTLTEAGRRIHAAVLFGVPEALLRYEGTVIRDAPSYFIFSRYGGDHWVEWLPRACPYYPCHFDGQRCDFCYCPFYPCGDESLGEWVKSTTKNRPVWNCAGCTLLHNPGIADYLMQNPEASLLELKTKERTSGKKA